jgi:hypothetical protein
MHIVEPPCSRRWADDVCSLFWGSPSAEGPDVSQNLNGMQQPLALCNRRFKQSLIVFRGASLQQRVGRRRVLAVLEVRER